MSRIEKVQRLRQLIAGPEAQLMPCCFDAISAKLIERAGYPLSFMSGFAVSAARLGLPDTGLISYGEMADQARLVCAGRQIPIIGDGDTGYGNAVNIQRTVHGYCQAGLAGIMIEDQVSPKRCGHTRGKEVVSRDEARLRIQAAVDARAQGEDIVIIARTDARATQGLDEAIARCQLFHELGADITFLEAPHSEAEMERYCREVAGAKMANMVEHGVTPILPRALLEAMGYTLIAYPLTLINTAITAMEQALQRLRDGQPVDTMSDFGHLQEVVGFGEYDQLAQRYKG